MRRLVVSEFVSLDGVMEGPGTDGSFEHKGWTMSYWHPEIGKFKAEELFASDALLLGRRTYEGFAAAWPSRTDDEFAERINGNAKYVVSTTLREATWENTTVLAGDLVDEVSALKQQPGLDILVAGSATLVQALLRHHLVDELRLEVYPVLLGSGTRLFGEGGFGGWELISHQTTANGVVLLVYRPTT